MFDWPRFLDRYRVPYATSGPNVGRGHIAVKCPWCGVADPSEHLSISLNGAGWRCWRNPRQHFGKSRARLVAALLRLPEEEARRLTGDNAAAPLPPDDEMKQVARRLLGVTDEEQTKPPLVFPQEFKRLRWSYASARPFFAYLHKRGYSVEDVGWLAAKYGLHYATRGAYRYRLIIPIEAQDGRLISFTGRSILKREAVRYRTAPVAAPYAGYTGPFALAAPGEVLFGLPRLWRAKRTEVLVVCEGPFDAFRISVLGAGRGVWGTALFGLNITDNQVLQLEELLARRFRKVVLLLDPDAATKVLGIKERVGALPITVARLPEGVEDPGALPAQEATRLFDKWLT